MIQELVSKARRRLYAQLVFDQGTLALTVAFAAVILLLVLGTQILNWYWPVLLLVTTFAIALWRVRGRVPTTYQVAQRVDEKLGLADAISTAIFFSDASTPASPAVIAAQRTVAESMATTADPSLATPYQMPRQGYSCLALMLVSATLLIVRYGFSGTLDLSQPMLRIPFDSLSGTPTVVAKNKAFPKQKMPEGFDNISIPSEGGEDQATEKKKTADEPAFKGESIEADGAEGKEAQMTKDGKSSDQEGKDAGEAGEKGEGSAAGDDQSQKDAGSNANSSKNAKSPSEGANQNSSKQEPNNSSLMEKMKDAMANMMSRMKMNPKSGEQSKQSAASQQGAAQSASAQKQAGQKGAPSPGKQGEGQSKSDEAGEQEGEGAAKQMNAQGKMSDSAGQKQQAQEGKSGAGKQDGEKDIKQAEQQAAMGKISELLGKRAQNVTGEIMVEVSSGRQQLKTQYTDKSAAHADSGGDITRDEVPAAYQQFVQQYFEQVRKAPASAPAAAAPAPAPAKK